MLKIRLHRKDYPHRWIWQPIRWVDVREKILEHCDAFVKEANARKKA